MLEVSNSTEEIAGEVEEVEFLLRSTVLGMEVEEVEAGRVVLQVFLQSEVAEAVEVGEEAEVVALQKRNLYSLAREATAMGTWRVVAVEVV